MASEPIIPPGVNAIGIAAFVGFLACWLGAAVFGFRLFRVMGSAEIYGGGLWTDPAKRKHFLPFFGFCLLGVVCGVLGFIFGGWPTGSE